MENKPNNEISELLARLQKNVEKKSEPKMDSVTPRNEESTEALLSLLKKNIGAEKEVPTSSGNEEYDIQGYEFEEESIAEPVNEKEEEIVEPTSAEPLNESASYSKEDEEILHSRVAELVNDSLEAEEMLELPLNAKEDTESVTPVAEDAAVSTDVIEEDTAEEAEEQMLAVFGEKCAQSCLHESTAKRFFGERASGNINVEPDASDFDDVDINLALALGSRETLEDSVGYFRVRSAKNGFYDPFWEEATAGNTYGYRGEEFRSYKQVDAIKQQYEQKRRKLKKRFIFTFLLSIVILFLEHMPFTSLKIPYFSEWMALPIFYYGLAVLFSVVLVLVSLKPILCGIRSLFLLRAEPFVSVACLTVLNFAYTLVLFLFARQGGVPVYNFAIAIFLLLGIADDGMRLAREKQTFDVVSIPKTKLSLERFEGNTEADSANAFSSKNDFFVEKSDFVGNFFTRSGRRPAQFSEYFHELAFSVLGALLISLVALCLEQSVLSALTMFVFAILVCVPMQFLTLGIYPFFRLTKGLSKLDSAVIGDAVTDEYNDADTIYLEDTEMFGKHGARIVGLRVYNDMEFYDILSYALSVFTVVGAPLCNVFDNSAREIKKKEGVRITGISMGGIEASVENEKTVYVGNLAYMRSRGYFPKRNPDDEKKIEIEKKIKSLEKQANEIVVANRNGLPKLVLMSREVYENGLGKVMDNPLINVRRDMELVAEPVLIRTFNNPAEIVRICENEMGKDVPVLRNGVDEIYVMDYEAYRMRKECFIKLL